MTLGVGDVVDVNCFRTGPKRGVIVRKHGSKDYLWCVTFFDPGNWDVYASAYPCNRGYITELSQMRLVRQLTDEEIALTAHILLADYCPGVDDEAA